MGLRRRRKAIFHHRFEEGKLESLLTVTTLTTNTKRMKVQIESAIPGSNTNESDWSSNSDWQQEAHRDKTWAKAKDNQ
jgi:hypothetical protein